MQPRLTSDIPHQCIPTVSYETRCAHSPRSMQGKEHVVFIVGKGTHSAGGVQKLKPAIEQLAVEERLTCIPNKPTEGALSAFHCPAVIQIEPQQVCHLKWMPALFGLRHACVTLFSFVAVCVQAVCMWSWRERAGSWAALLVSSGDSAGRCPSSCISNDLTFWSPAQGRERREHRVKGIFKKWLCTCCNEGSGDLRKRPCAHVTVLQAGHSRSAHTSAWRC